MKPHETTGARDRRPGDGPSATRPKRRVARGPIGFAQVFGMVQRDGAPGRRRSVAEEAVAVPTALLLDPQAIAGHQQPITAETVVEQPRIPLRLTPQQALAATVRAARELDTEEGMQELQVELEPAHLGPLLVRIKFERGRLVTRLIARERDAAATLDAGSAGLEARLRDLAPGGLDLAVVHDSTLQLDRLGTDVEDAAG